VVPWEGGEMRKVSWDRKGGPLAAFADGYRADLVRLGFTANSVVTHVVLMGQLSRWMAQAGVRVDELAPARIDEFLDSRRAGGQRRVPTARTLVPLLACLRRRGSSARRRQARRPS
jgi:integrase/recombinase XerD